jgi:RNA polymerase subunit RPABC4/transcription elongation factor Spt4
MLESGTLWGNIITLVGLLALAYVVAVWVSLVVWTHRDVQHRSADQQERLAAVLLVALFSVPGWFVYLLLRPGDTLEDSRIDELQAQLFARELAVVGSCARCRRRVADDFLVCPFCREELRTPCSSCGRAISNAWEVCAYCGEPSRRAQPAAAAAPRGGPAAPRPAARPRPLVPTEAR